MRNQVRQAAEIGQWARAVLTLATEVQSQHSRDRRKELTSESCLPSSLSCSHNKEIKNLLKYQQGERVQESSQGSLAVCSCYVPLRGGGRAAGPHVCLPFVTVDQVSQGKAYASSPIEIGIKCLSLYNSSACYLWQTAQGIISHIFKSTFYLNEL